MKKKGFLLYFVFLFQFLSVLTLNAQEAKGVQEIKFAPLPMDKSPNLFKSNSPMLEYLEETTGLKFKFVYVANYGDLLEKFSKKEIDLVELGPLPYVKLKEKYPKARPLVTFLSDSGSAAYDCRIITNSDNINSLADIKKETLVKLTQKMSTCGYLLTQKMFKDKGLDLNNFQHQYIGTHSDVVLEIVMLDNSIGTVKSSVLENYPQFGLRTIQISDEIPEFALIYNQDTIQEVDAKKIESALVKIKPLSKKEDASLTKNWGSNIKYGAISTPKDSYLKIEKAILEVGMPK